MSLPNLTLEQCQIGGLDAWTTDATNIRGTFLPVIQYHQLSEHNRCFLSGRRGAGKSAIAIMSRESPLWDWHNVIPGGHAQYGAYLDLIKTLSDMKDQGIHIDIKRFITMVWKYALPVVMLQTVCDYCNHRRENGPLVTRIANFLTEKKFYGKEIGSILMTLFDNCLTRIADRKTSASGLAYLHEEYNWSAPQKLVQVL
jgi:hypothetical protein